MRRQKATQSSLHSSQQEILEEPQNKWTLTFLPWSILAWFSAMNDIISIVLQKLLEFSALCLKQSKMSHFCKDKTYSCFVFIFDSKFTLLDNFQILSKVILSCFLLQVSEFVLVFGNFLQRRLHTREEENRLKILQKTNIKVENHLQFASEVVHLNIGLIDLKNYTVL